MPACRTVLTFSVAGLLAATTCAHAAPPVPWSDNRLLSHQTGSEALATAQDRSLRLTVAVFVDGHGPYPFVVDTGATRTVISRELAATLRLPPGPIVSLDDALGRVAVETVRIDRLDLGGRAIRRLEAPILAAGNLGADGMLGIDSLRDQSVVMDFDTKRFLVGRAAEDADTFGIDTTIVTGRRRFGQLILVDAESRTVPIFVILDSGAQSTLGNAALRRLMTPGLPAGRLRTDTLISVTGRRTEVEIDTMPEIQLGGVTIRNLPVAYARLHTFTQFGLDDTPALLLGMDVLHLFHNVAIDFRRGEASFSAD